MSWLKKGSSQNIGVSLGDGESLPLDPCSVYHCRGQEEVLQWCFLHVRRGGRSREGSVWIVLCIYSTWFAITGLPCFIAPYLLCLTDVLFVCLFLLKARYSTSKKVMTLLLYSFKCGGLEWNHKNISEVCRWRSLSGLVKCKFPTLLVYREKTKCLTSCQAFRNKDREEGTENVHIEDKSK